MRTSCTGSTRQGLRLAIAMILLAGPASTPTAFQRIFEQPSPAVVIGRLPNTVCGYRRGAGPIRYVHNSDNAIRKRITAYCLANRLTIVSFDIIRFDTCRRSIMSGHSKWATTKHKKAAIDAKRGKLFAKLIKNIEIAARTGRRRPGRQPVPVRRHLQGQESVHAGRQHHSRRQARLLVKKPVAPTTRTSCTRATRLPASACIIECLDRQPQPRRRRSPFHPDQGQRLAGHQRFRQLQLRA